MSGHSAQSGARAQPWNAAAIDTCMSPEAKARLTIDALLQSLEGSDAALVVATHDPAVAQRLRTVWRMDHGLLSLPDLETPS